MSAVRDKKYSKNSVNNMLDSRSLLKLLQQEKEATSKAAFNVCHFCQSLLSYFMISSYLSQTATLNAKIAQKKELDHQLADLKTGAGYPE